jgi:hypothetical protein
MTDLAVISWCGNAIFQLFSGQAFPENFFFSKVLVRKKKSLGKKKKKKSLGKKKKKKKKSLGKQGNLRQHSVIFPNGSLARIHKIPGNPESFYTAKLYADFFGATAIHRPTINRPPIYRPTINQLLKMVNTSTPNISTPNISTL